MLPAKPGPMGKRNTRHRLTRNGIPDANGLVIRGGYDIPVIRGEEGATDPRAVPRVDR